MPKLKLTLNTSWVTVDGRVSSEHWKELQKVTSFRPAGWMHMPAVQEGRWDGFIRLLKNSYGVTEFPTGLMRTVTQKLEELGYLYEVVDTRELPKKQFSWKWTYPHKMRDYQKEAVGRAKRRSRGIWNLATGSGKMATAARLFYELGLKGVITVLTEEAVRDTAKEFEDCIGGANIGVWYGKEKRIGDIVVTTVPSVMASIKNKNELYDHFQDTQVLIMDEGHLGGADTYYDMMMQSRAYYKIAQTGTAYRSDGKDLKLAACTGPIMIRKIASELQEEGILAKSKVSFHYSPPPDHIERGELIKLSASDRYKESIVYNEPRNRLIGEIYQSRDVSTVIVVKLIEHGEILEELLGVPFVHGKVKNRDQIQDGLNDGSIKGVIATSIFDMSVNIPNLERLINAPGHSPKSRQTQRHGRILRRADGKEFAEFVDFYDWWDTSVLNHSVARYQYMEEEGHKIELIGSASDIEDIL